MNRFVEKGITASKLVLTDPYDFWRRLRYVMRPKSFMIKINGIKFKIDVNLDPAMRSMCFKTYQSGITAIFKKFLREGDTFIDVGANIGYMSAFAMGLVGKTGEVHAFEPVPQYFNRLENVCKDNPGYRFYMNRVAIGKDEGVSTIVVTNRWNIGWNTMVPDFMSKDTVKEKIEITVSTLDNYLYSKSVKKLRLVKIDTEGYEFPVIKGFQQYLRKVEELPILVVEVNPTAYKKLNTSIADFEDFMVDLGYVACSIDLVLKVQITKFEKITDVVFLPQSIAYGLP